MTFLEALQSDENAQAVDSLSTALKSDDLPADVRSDAGTIAGVMLTIDNTIDEFRSEAALVPDFFQNNFYGVEGARQMQTEANLKVIRDNDPTGLINRLEGRIKAFLSELADRAKPLPPTTDAALMEALLMGARQDARDALTSQQGNLTEAILKLQQEALENGEDALAYLLGASEWAARYVKAHSVPEDQIAFDRIRGTLRDNVSDPSATPYRQAAERLAELKDVPEGYRVTWKLTLEESGLLTEQVQAALGAI
jgi:hypothetical protein